MFGQNQRTALELRLLSIWKKNVQIGFDKVDEILKFGHNAARNLSNATYAGKIDG